MTTGGRAVSMADVAVRAGVSAMTVSRVLNNKGGVAGPTHERVLAAVASLRYRPNQSARNLRAGTTDRITVLVRTHPNLDFRLVTAFEDVARADDRTVEVTIAGPVGSPARGDGNTFGETGASSTIVVDVDVEEAATALWQSEGAPAVLVTAEMPLTKAFPAVSTHDDEGARMMVGHLVAWGHRRIAHVAGPRGSGRSVARQRGWLRALAETGLGRGRMVRGDWSSESGERAAAALMAHTEPPTAIFVADDFMAIGVLKQLHRLGLRVPDDVSVVGFGDLPGTDSLIPGLTTVRLDYVATAGAALRLIRDGTAPRSDRVSCDRPRLVLRESTGPRGTD